MLSNNGPNAAHPAHRALGISLTNRPPPLHSPVFVDLPSTGIFMSAARPDLERSILQTLRALSCSEGASASGVPPPSQPSTAHALAIALSFPDTDEAPAPVQSMAAAQPRSPFSPARPDKTNLLAAFLESPTPLHAVEHLFPDPDTDDERDIFDDAFTPQRQRADTGQMPAPSPTPIPAPNQPPHDPDPHTHRL